MPMNQLMASGLFELDQRAAEILGMEEEHRLAMGTDTRLAIAQDPRARGFEAIARRLYIRHLIAEMVHAARRAALEKARDRRVLSQRRQQFDLGVGQGHE